MIDNPKHTAVLVFVRSLKEELNAKTLVTNDFNKNVQLFRALNQGAINLAESLGLPVFVVDTEKQIGATFGERFKNAFQTLFNKGFQNVISVGNDVPNLDQAILLGLTKALNQHDVVFGATSKNGLYTVGFSKASFSKVDFTAINWQSKTLLATFLEQIHLHQLHMYASSVILEDINNPTQLKQFVRRFVSIKPLFEIFFQVLLQAVIKNYKVYIAPFIDVEQSKSTLFRGPPVTNYTF